MNQSYEYSCRRLELKDGPVYVDFDFTPENPTETQLQEYIKKSCATCIYNEPLEAELHGCNLVLYADTGCECWIGNSEVYAEAQKRYWLDLHRKTMKGKPVPYGRNLHEWDAVPFLTYPDDE